MMKRTHAHYLHDPAYGRGEDIMFKPIVLLSMPLFLACAAYAANGSPDSLVSASEPMETTRVQAGPQGSESEAAAVNAPAGDMLQVIAKYLTSVDHDMMESRVEQANQRFLQMVRQYGYRQAVTRWTGSPYTSEAR